MHYLISILLSTAFFFHSLTAISAPLEKNVTQPQKKYDLVLLHGLANKHKWSDSFLNTCLEIWGSGRVFILYTGSEKTVKTRIINERKLIIGGGNGNQAGTDSLEKQVAYASGIIDELQKNNGLNKQFSIIAHSMGGLVARKYIYENPGTVAGLVTLGTPHHGSPLAESFQWFGHFLSATDAIEDLKPANMKRFNKTYPVENAPLASNHKMFTIRGVPERTECFGWLGELLLGCQILSTFYDTKNDGLVPYKSALIKGAQHIADFPNYDHYDLVREPDVAKKAAEYLP